MWFGRRAPGLCFWKIGKWCGVSLSGVLSF